MSRDHWNRRRFLQSTALAAAGLSAPSVLRAQGAAVKIGVLHPVSGALSYSGQQGRIGAIDHRVHFHLGVELRHAASSRFGLGRAQAVHAMGNLTLQVGQVHRVRVDDRDASHTGRGQVHQHGRPQTTRANDQGMGLGDALLPVNAQVFKQDVTRVAKQLLVVHV